MSLYSTEPQTILFIAANPKDTCRLRLNQELRDISEGLQRARKREQFNLEQCLAARPHDIQRAVLDLDPQIIHFSGHGGGDKGLVFEDALGKIKLIDGDALASLLRLFADKIACVVINGCYSEVQAKAIARHIPYVIGMKQAIKDRAAIAFAVGFYDALGAGRDIEFAYKLGCAAIRLEGITEDLTPVLHKCSNPETTTIHPSPSPLTAIDASTEEPVEGAITDFKSKLTGLQRQDLEAERAGLQRRHNLLSQKIQRLGEALAIETDPATRFKLEIQLQQAKAEQDPISREISNLNCKLEE